MINQEEIFDQIRLERERQDRKWGTPQINPLPAWMTILGEEYGEACQEVLRVYFGDRDPAELIDETIQVAAVCVAMLENLHHVVNLDNYKPTIQKDKQPMSANKRKYFVVTTTQLVSANNKTDAINLVTGVRGIDANVVATERSAERISATTAKTFTA